MRPDTPTITSRRDLRRYVDGYAHEIDGRLGVRIGLLTDEGRIETVVDRNTARRFTSASVIKVLVLCALYREVGGDREALEQPEPLDSENRVGGDGVIAGFDRVRLSLRDLSHAMIVVSDNAAANQLIDYLGVASINATAETLGLTETHLGRKMMETLRESERVDESPRRREAAGDADSGPINTVSPRDCVDLFDELYHGDQFEDHSRDAMLETLRGQTDESMFVRYLPHETVVAHKTGRLPTAALDAGVVERSDRPHLAFAVCCDRLDNGGEGTDIVAEIGDAVYAWSNS